VLVSCWVSDSRSPATTGLLVVAFLMPPMASRGRWPGKTVMEVVGIALHLWVVCGHQPFPLQGDSSVSRRRRRWIEMKKRLRFWTRVAVFQLGPLSFNICFNRTLGPNCNWTPALRHRLQNGPWTLISCNFNLNQFWILIFLQLSPLVSLIKLILSLIKSPTYQFFQFPSKVNPKFILFYNNN